MRTLLLASAALLALGGTGLAQNAAGNPRSNSASNITAADTHSQLAPALPSPGVDLTPEQLLTRAEQAVRSGQTGLAQQALEEAETRLLTRATAPSNANTPDNGPRIDAITKALHSLAARDKAGTLSAIQMAMSRGGMENGSMGSGGMGAGSMNNGTMNNGSMGAGSMGSNQNMGANGEPMGPNNPANGVAQQKTQIPNGAPATPMGQ